MLNLGYENQEKNIEPKMIKHSINKPIRLNIFMNICFDVFFIS